MSGLFTKDIVVLDVTSRLVSAIVGVKKAQSVFGIKSIVEKPQPGYAEGEWFDAQTTVRVVKEALSEAMQNANSRSKRLFIGVPSEFVSVVSKEVTVELDRRRRVADDDIEFLFSKGNDFNASDFDVINTSAVHYSINGDNKQYNSVVGMNAESITGCVSYMLAERKFVAMFDKIAHDFGFKDVRYVASSWAQCVTLLDERQRENVYVLIDIGYLSSSISLAKGEGILDMKSFSVGGAHISADITEALGMPFEFCEEAKQCVDINLKYDEDTLLVDKFDEAYVYQIKACDVVPLVKGRLDMLASIIKNVLSGFGQDMPSYMSVYLTGEGIASMRGAKKYLSERIGRDIEIVTPKLPGFVKPEDSSKTALLLVADTLSKYSFGDVLKSIFNGGKK